MTPLDAETLRDRAAANVGNNNVTAVPGMDRAALVNEAARLARLSDLGGAGYTAAILRRLCDEIEGRAAKERQYTAARTGRAAAMRRGEAI